MKELSGDFHFFIGFPKKKRALRSRAIFALKKLSGKFIGYLLFIFITTILSSSPLAVLGFVFLFGWITEVTHEFY